MPTWQRSGSSGDDCSVDVFTYYITKQLSRADAPSHPDSIVILLTKLDGPYFGNMKVTINGTTYTESGFDLQFHDGDVMQVMASHIQEGGHCAYTYRNHTQSSNHGATISVIEDGTLMIMPN